MPKLSTSLLPAQVSRGRHRNPSNPTPESLIKIAAAAALLGVSVVTIRRRVADRSLPCIRIHERLYFKLSELHRFIEAHREV